MPAALLLPSACTRAAPAVEFCSLKVVYQQVEGKVQAGFSFFAIVNDEDGPEDLSEMRLYNDAEGLMWLMTSDNWTVLEDRGKTWVGSKMLAMSEGELLPAGQFRVSIVDKSGDTGETTFGFDTPADSPYRFPSLSVVEGDYSVRSSYPDNYLLMYYQDGSYRSLLKLANLEGTLASLRLPSDVYGLALWADDSGKAVSALTGKSYIRE
ncbi:MAG: hypothetical protein LBS82_01460 [Spirochaetaceae bacterium]|nr:hypothetical protein [Spirochaetaceae bacterium]